MNFEVFVNWFHFKLSADPLFDDEEDDLFSSPPKVNSLLAWCKALENSGLAGKWMYEKIM